MNLSFFEPKYKAKREFLLFWSIASIAHFVIFTAVNFFDLLNDSWLVEDFTFAALGSAFLYSVLMFPLLEELAYRSWLTDKRYYLAAGVLLCGVMLFQFTGGIEHASDATVLPTFCLGFLGLFTARFGFMSAGKVSKVILVAGLISSLAYGSSYAFDAAGGETGSLGAAILAVLAHFVSGCLFWLARIRVGLLASVLLHASLNVMPTLAGVVGPSAVVAGLILALIGAAILKNSRNWEVLSKI
jgi:hypothetical protein